MNDDDFNFGDGLIEGLQEALSWKRGEIALEVRNVDPMPVERIKRIRKAVAKSAAEFEQKFGIPAATLNNWEQGRRKPDLASRLLLKVIETNPAAVEAAAHSH